jgi:predicted 2-oxoglutarate/Fe(II)-dependent dioxygenase YbiX
MNADNAGWGLGDRLPNVRLRMADGTRRTLHADFADKSLWLCLAVDPETVAQLPIPHDHVYALCIVGDNHVPSDSAWRFCEVDPNWSAQLPPGVLWITDTNLRLQARYKLPLSADPLPPEVPETLNPAITATIAPILLIPGVFEPDLCQRLIDHLEVDCAGGTASGVVVIEDGRRMFQIDPSIKQRRESPPLDPQLEARMNERIMRRALPEIARVFNFAAKQRDGFKLLAYPENAGYFRAHRDNETSDVAHRRFAMSVNLNAGSYSGGEFRYPEFGPHLFSPETGGAIVFSCSLLHEILPVTRGIRYAMTTFLS